MIVISFLSILEGFITILRFIVIFFLMHAIVSVTWMIGIIIGFFLIGQSLFGLVDKSLDYFFSKNWDLNYFLLYNNLLHLNLLLNLFDFFNDNWYFFFLNSFNENWFQFTIGFFLHLF